MARSTTPTDGKDRFRRIIDRLDEQEAAAVRPLPAPLAAQPLAPAYEMKSATNGRTARARRRRALSWDGFKTFAILFSFIVNLILVVVVVALGATVFRLKQDIAQPLVGGLHNSFVALDQAHIRTTIPVETTIPVSDKVTAQFDLPLQQNTIVTLTQPTVITGASVTIEGGVLQLSNAPTTIVLPAGAQLPVSLNLSVPVNQDIPIELQIPVNIPVVVDIPLAETELHQPFASLRDLFAPYNELLESTPDSWADLIFSPTR
ncbi:MAG: hypothetical protein ACE5FI_10485 [Anaerolineales bacterium]